MTGITTMENLLESILGIDIKDEKDVEKYQNDVTTSSCLNDDLSRVTDNLMKSVIIDKNQVGGEIESMMNMSNNLG